VVDAVKALGDWNVLGAPLVARKVTDCVVGFIDVFDILYYLVEQQPVRETSAGEHYPPGFLGYEIHPDVTVGEVAALIKVQQRRWKVLPVTVSAIDAIRELCAHQRLVLVDAASGAATNIISQSSVLHWLAKQLPSPSGGASSGNAELAQHLEAATLAPFVKRVRTVHVTDKLRSAIHQLVHTGFSAIAVTDPDSEAVVGELKMSGMLRLFLAHDRESWKSRLAESAPKITDFQYDVAAYLEQSTLDAAARPPHSDREERPPGDGEAIGLRPECGWGMAILALERNHARQANIVDEKSRCIGIVSLTDIMSALFGDQ
jgi:CBS domain-containing protein